MFDFQRVFGLDWWGQIDQADPDTTGLLVAGLMRWPHSLTRAAWLDANPPMEPDPDDLDDEPVTVDWLGLDQAAMLALRLYNAQVPVKNQIGLKILPYASDEEQSAIALATILNGG